MRSSKILEMIESGKIEDLKAQLQDEIFEETLKRKPNAKKRYTAMKKYFTYVSSVRDALTKPCVIEFQDKEYTSFTNSYSLVLTKESCGEIEMFDNCNGAYPDVTRFIDFGGVEQTLDFNKIFAEAKSKGYKLKKSEVTGNGYLMLYEGTYYRLGLIDASYGIINDGEKASVFHVPGDYKSRLVINNSLGVCLIMPVNYEPSPYDTTTIIEVKPE